MTYPASVRVLYSLGNEVKVAKLELSRIERLLEALGAPHRGGRYIHVAGTNGKGSTCAMIESGLRAAGWRTGLYTSPHLSEPVERIRIGGIPVAPEEFAAACRQVREAVERLLAGGELDAHPTYVETVTAMAFLLFREARVEVAVLEVGLGGRLDATNVVQPELAVITRVDFDHEAFLGKSLEAIAAEKAGILKPGARALFAPQRPEVGPVLEARAAALGIVPARVSEWEVGDLEVHAFGSRFTARSGNVLHLECPLAGEHQVANALTAAAALELAGVPAGAIERGIRATSWPGRLERVAERPDLFLDGAHNPAGARALAAYIQRFHASKRVWLVYGAMRDKAVAEMAGILAPVAGEVILTAPAQARAVRPEVLRELFDHPRRRTAAGLEEALALLSEAGPQDAVFITGSLFLVGEARARLVQ
ncbi:MAG: bifunctional folylpolyglutamate synthase/dihydrofolate synthase [Acidobacteria bacterium]|nr:bifunctional folylpolyglutamate synthase/dihydrofolate synthase [Acidobacteriota bacterium]